MSLAPLLVSAAAESEHSGINPWVVGGATMLLLVALIVGLLAFGAGREHS